MFLFVPSLPTSVMALELLAELLRGHGTQVVTTAFPFVRLVQLYHNKLVPAKWSQKVSTDLRCRLVAYTSR